MRPSLKHNIPSLKKKRQFLRNNATPAERELWKYLKGENLEGRKFRRQYSIGYYILDFYCFSEKLIVELDGECHFTDSGYLSDLKRDAVLTAAGYKILRFENKWVFQNIDAVLEEIKRNFKS